MGPAFWAEPVNAVTNLAFIVSAILVLLAWHRTTQRSPSGLFLGLLIGIIGIGSFLFHTFATVWAAAADSLPILVFILTYLYLAVRHYIGLTMWASLIATAAYIPVSFLLVPLLSPIVGSSSGYVPALLAIFIVGILMLGRNRPLASGLIVTGIVFFFSIAFRMADEAFCAALPLGTHFMWHLLNAVVLYRLALIYLRHVEQGRTQPAS